MAHAGFSGIERVPVSRIIPFQSYQEKSGLPPHLMTTFFVDCSELFQGVVRHDSYDPRSQSVIISIGGQVRIMKTGCQGSLRKVEVDAGPTYSGRPYQVQQYEQR